MTETTFEGWWTNRRPYGSADDPWLGPASKAAWEAGRAALLSGEGKTLEQVVAARVLAGGEGELGVLADWLDEKGRLDPLVSGRLTALRGVLTRMTKAMEHFFLFGADLKLVNEANSLLGLPQYQPLASGVIRTGSGTFF